LHVPRFRGRLALAADGHVQAEGPTQPYPAFPLCPLWSHLQFTDLLDHLLEQALGQSPAGS
jgi:hypothetical protein